MEHFFPLLLFHFISFSESPRLSRCPVACSGTRRARRAARRETSVLGGTQGDRVRICLCSSDVPLASRAESGSIRLSSRGVDFLSRSHRCAHPVAFSCPRFSSPTRANVWQAASATPGAAAEAAELRQPRALQNGSHTLLLMRGGDPGTPSGNCPTVAAHTLLCRLSTANNMHEPRLPRECVRKAGIYAICQRARPSGAPTALLSHDLPAVFKARSQSRA